ncbi:site-specific integrase [Jatrophihabitans sp. DSM 45814]
MKRDLYPEYLGPIVSEIAGRADSFDLLREQALEGQRYNTARAYWGDLEHWRDWCERECMTDPFGATTQSIVAYLNELSELAYSPNTRARRLTALRAFYRAAVAQDLVGSDPTAAVPPIRRRR